ncbi:MAG: arginine deiminase [Lachnospiraceae bacterium]|nr:arginine deiminase [Lachnospiraceae bacterium]
MINRIHNFSEIGKLNKVMLHRIGREIEALVPENFSRLLFDDIPYLEVARKEHDGFADILRANGVEVVYYVDEATKALQDARVRESFLKRFVAESPVSSETAAEAVLSYLHDLPVRDMVEKCIEGVKKSDMPSFQSDHFADYISSYDPFFLEPLPNLYFTRDPGACVGEGISIHHMSTHARRRESLLLEYIFRFSPDFRTGGEEEWYHYDDAYSIEGGDVLVLNEKVVAVGLSERTTAAAIECFAKNLLSNSGFRKVIVLDIPKARAFMHLDTVFTMVDYDKFTIHPEIEQPLRLFEMTLERGGRVRFSSMTDSLSNILKKTLKLPAVKLIKCGGDDRMAAQREQWNDGSNTLAIAPGKVVTYERNYVTNDLLSKEGIEVLPIAGSEISRGRGGPRCMSFPINREDLP